MGGQADTCYIITKITNHRNKSPFFGMDLSKARPRVLGSQLPRYVGRAVTVMGSVVANSLDHRRAEELDYGVIEIVPRDDDSDDDDGCYEEVDEVGDLMESNLPAIVQSVYGGSERHISPEEAPKA